MRLKKARKIQSEFARAGNDSKKYRRILEKYRGLSRWDRLTLFWWLALAKAWTHEWSEVPHWVKYGWLYAFRKQAF